MQNLPEGLREEVALFIQRIQKKSASETPRIGQDLSPEIYRNKQSEISGIGMQKALLTEQHTFQFDGVSSADTKENKQREVRIDGSSVSDGCSGREVAVQPFNGQNKSKGGIPVLEHTDSLFRNEYGDVGLGRISSEGNNEVMDGELDVTQESGIAGAIGSEPKSAIAHGWLDDVYNDMEGQGYAVGAAVLPACAVGKPHQRKRLWFVAYSEQPPVHKRCEPSLQRGRQTDSEQIGLGCGIMGNAEHDGHAAGQVARSNETPIYSRTQEQEIASESQGAGQSEHVADPNSGRSAGRLPGETGECGEDFAGQQDSGERKPDASAIGGFDGSRSAREHLEWIACPDGKSRPVKSGIRLLAHGVQYRASVLHALGNAIVPQVAAAFIKACQG